MSTHRNLLKIPGSILKFLSMAIEPPELPAIKSAVENLVDFGALSDMEELTALGYHVANIPCDIHIAKMLIFGAMFSCIDPILTIAAIMSSKTPFNFPMDKKKEATEGF